MPHAAGPDLDVTMQVLLLVALLLYLAPSAFGSYGPASRFWLHRAAAATLAIGIAIALAASASWFLR